MLLEPLSEGTLPPPLVSLGVHVAGNWMRDLLLSDPPTVRTFVAPFSVRRWMPLDEFTARVIWNGTVFLACVAMAIVVWRYRQRDKLGKTAATLEQFATDAGLSAKYLTMVWAVLSEPEAAALHYAGTVTDGTDGKRSR